MAHLMGSRSAGWRNSLPFGIGAESYPLAGSWTGITGKAGEIVFVDISQIAVKGENVFCVMAVAACNLKYTLQHPSFACNPDADVQSKVAWGNDQTPAPNTIEECSAPAFTAVRVEFTAAGDVYFYSR